ncbi:unnamed protein product [Effrenium voratum]|nr:unnamed protein product [Effrenium voratum]
MENEMPLLGVEPDDESVEILVEAFFRQGLRKGAATWLARLRGKPSEDLLGVMREKLKETEEDVLQYWLGQPKLAGLRRSRGLVRRLLQLSEVAQAEAWLERCLADGFEPDRLCFTDLAREWLQQGEPKRAALWLDRMVAEGLLPSREVTALVLAAGLEADASDSEKAEGDATQRVLRLAQSGRASEASAQLLEALAQGRLVQAPAFEALLAALAAGGRAEEASEWFQRMLACGIQPGVKACCALVDAQAEPRKAAATLRRLEADGYALDHFAYTAVVAAFAGRGQCEEAEAWLVRLEERFSSDQAAYNALLKGLVRRRNFTSAEDLLGRMATRQLRPNEISYTTILGGLAESGHAGQVAQWFDRMRAASLTPNAVTYNAIIGGLAKHKLEQAEEWLQRMKNSSIEPEVQTYNRLLAGCAEHKDLPRAEAWFQEMRKEKVPDAVSYNTMINVCAKVHFATLQSAAHELQCNRREEPAPAAHAAQMRFRLAWPLCWAAFGQDQRAALGFTHMYTMAGSSDDVLLWQPHCRNRICDEFSVGDGYCLMRTSSHSGMDRLKLVDPEEIRRLAAGPPVWQVASNCRVRGLEGTSNRTSLEAWPVKVQLLHCPKTVPLAILTVPKCGTTSTINWVLQMEGEDQIRSLYNGGRLFLHRQGPGEFMNRFVVKELIRAAEQGAIPNSKLSSEEFGNQIMYRALHRYKPGYETYDEAVTVEREFLPPAHMCPLCCIYGRDRQHVVLARNPFVRVMSYYRFSWLNNPTWGAHRWTSWPGYEDYVRFVLNIRDTMPGKFANRLQWAKNAENTCRQAQDERVPGTALHSWLCKTVYLTLSADDIFHLRPVSDMVRDKRFLAGPQIMDDMLVLHLETLKQDIAGLEETLCSRFGFCKGLPPFPSVLPGKNIRDSMMEGGSKEHCSFKEATLQWRNCTAPPWLQLWTPDLTALVVRHYEEDFRWLGYATDPAHLLPEKEKMRRRLAFNSAGMNVAEPQVALKYLRNLQRQNLRPNIVAWSSMLSACAAQGGPEASLPGAQCVGKM